MVSQLDIFSSLAALVGSEAKVGDSQQMLDVFMGKSDDAREDLILEATSRTALRKGEWIMIPPYKGAALNKAVNIETGNSKEYQLYNLKNDVVQQQNLADSNKDKLDEMIAVFEKIRGDNSKTQKIKLK